MQIINDSNNHSIDSLLYVRHRSNNDWNCRLDAIGYNYGLNIQTAEHASHALQLNG